MRRFLRVASLMLSCVLVTAQGTRPTLYVGPPDKGEGDAHIVLKKAIQDFSVRVTLVVREPADLGSTYSFSGEQYIKNNYESRVRCSFAVSIYNESDGTEVFTHVGMEMHEMLTHV